MRKSRECDRVFGIKTKLTKEEKTVRKYMVALGIAGLLAVSGCGQSEKLGAFQESIENFYAEVSGIESEIRHIDVKSEDAVTALLILLEQMSVQLDILAKAEVPDEFASVAELAQDAQMYMTEASRLYQEAFSEDQVKEPYVEAAIENYESAMKRIDYIAVLLQGEIPEGATVVEGEGNEFDPYTESE